MYTDKKQDSQSIQLAQLFVNLDKLRSLVRTDINPACFHLAIEESDELTQTLELAASAVDLHLKKYGLRLFDLAGGRDE